jgi:multidrug efflux pump
MVLVTGMTVGTIFTLFVVPVFYSLIAAQHQSQEPAAIPERMTPEKLMLAGTDA